MISEINVLQKSPGTNSVNSVITTPRKKIQPTTTSKIKLLVFYPTLLQAKLPMKVGLIRHYSLEFAFARCLGKSKAFKAVCYWFRPHIQFSLTGNN